MTTDDGIGREGGPEKETRPRTDRDVGQALRAAYVETVEEEIPAELLDLLGKLG